MLSDPQIKCINCYHKSKKRFVFDKKYLKSAIKWIFHTKPNSVYNIRLNLEYPNNEDLSNHLIKLESIFFSEDLIQRIDNLDNDNQKSTKVNLNQKAKVNLTHTFMALSLLSSLTLNFIPSNNLSFELEICFEITERNERILSSPSLILGTTDLERLKMLSEEVDDKRRENLRENLRFLYSFTDYKNNNNYRYIYIHEKEVIGKNIEIIYCDPTEKFDMDRLSNEYFNRLRNGEDEVQPVVLIDQDFAYYPKGAGYYNYGPFPSWLLQDNHNTGVGLALIFELLKRTVPKSFSFRSSNITKIKDVFEIHKRLFFLTNNQRFKSVKEVLEYLNPESIKDYPEDNPERFRLVATTVPKGIKEGRDLWYKISATKITEARIRYKLGICIHLGNSELFDEIDIILYQIAKSGYSSLIMIHIIDLDILDFVLDRLRIRKISDYIITIAPNRGMDLGGFMTQIDVLLKSKFIIDILMKFHTKSDKKWRRDLFISLIANQETLEQTIEMTEMTDNVIIPLNHLNNAKTDVYNSSIISYYMKLYNWIIPDYFSAGTVFSVPWHLLRTWWSTISKHSPGETFYLFKNRYVTNNRESYAHAWERIISGYLPYNLNQRSPTPITFKYPIPRTIMTIRKNRNYEYTTRNRMKDPRLFARSYHTSKISYCNYAPTVNLKDLLLQDYWEFQSEEGLADIIFFDLSVSLDKINQSEVPIKILWVRYTDTIKLREIYENDPQSIDYDIILTDELETELVFRELGILDGYFLGNQLDLANSMIIHELIYNKISINNSKDLNPIIIRVYCGEEIEKIHHWGDYLLAKNLKWQLENLGFSTIIETNVSIWSLSDMSRIGKVRSSNIPDNLSMEGIEELADEEREGRRTIIYLGGYNKYKPNTEDRNILWFYSHPSRWLSDLNQFRPYDIICVASLSMISKLSFLERDGKRICYLPQVFVYDEGNEEKNKQIVEPYKYRLSFIGNSRNVYREVVREVLEGGLRLNIWGLGWDEIIPLSYQKMVKLRWINNVKLSGILRQSNIIVNDHWPDMRDEGFVSMKTFEFMANKAFFISDKVHNIEDVSKDIICYQNGEELIQLIRSVRDNKEDKKMTTLDRFLDREEIIERLYLRYKEIYARAIVTLKSII